MATFHQRFQKEGKTIISLSHTNIKTEGDKILAGTTTAYYSDGSREIFDNIDLSLEQLIMTKEPTKFKEYD